MASPASDPRRSRRIPDWLPVALWALAGGVCCALLRGLEPNLLEEGIELHVAQRLAQGERLYRDVIVFTGPLPFELLALLFRLFGEEVGVTRAAVIACHAAASGAAFALARAAQPTPLAHAAALAYASASLLLFPLFSIYYYTTIAFHLSVIAAWAAWRGLTSMRFAVAAGVLVAGVALCKQTLGVCHALTFGLALLLAGRPDTRAFRGFVLGGAGAAALTVALYLLSGTLDEAFFAMVSLPLSLQSSYELPFLELWPLGELSKSTGGSQNFYLPYFYLLLRGVLAEPSSRVILVTQLLFALPLLAALAALVSLASRRAPPARALHAALLLAWLPNLMPRADWGHLAHVLPIAVAHLCLAVPGAARSARGWRWTRGVAAAVLVLALGAGAVAAQRVIELVSDPWPLSERVPLRPVSGPLKEEHVRSVIRFLSENVEPGEPIFVPRAEPLIYFATDTRNPTPYPGVFPAIREQQQRTILEALEGVRYVVMSDVDQPAMTYYREELPEVQTYLERHFAPARPFSDGELHWLSVLERVPDRGATLVDLFALRESGRPFTRASDGTTRPAPLFAERLGTRRNRRPLAFLIEDGGGGIEFDVDVPEQAVFQGDVSLGGAYSEVDVYRTPPLSRIVVSIVEPDAPVEIAEITLRKGWSQRWLPLEADLSAWAGRRVTLRMELFRSTEIRRTRVTQVGFLGSPRIARRAGGEAGPRDARADAAPGPPLRVR
jgi:hypothetical protein